MMLLTLTGSLTTMSDTIRHDHPEDYTGVPYHTFITVDGKTFTSVVDFVHDGTLHYYQLNRLAVDQRIAFTQLLEGYYEGNHHLVLPLSVYISANNFHSICSPAYGLVDIKHISNITGPCPYHWFAGIKTKWKRKDMVTGQVTCSKARRPRDVIEAEKAMKEARRADKRALQQATNLSNN